MSRKKIACVTLALAAQLAALGMVSTALAHEPTGEYAVFKECPLSVTNIDSCVYALTTSGEVRIGSSSVPITRPIVFQGGETREVIELPGEEFEERRAFVGAANGETLSHSPQPVPGGLLGIVAPESLPLELGQTINKLVSEGLAGVYATTELVGPAQYSFAKLANGEPAGLVMPTRIHLENVLLGSACYIGSASEPITFSLTTGTTSPPPPNEPIGGSPGIAEIRNGGSLIIDNGASAVDNSFSVPVANGCGGLLSAVIDPAIDLKLGLPSAAGHNAARLNSTLEQASAGAVRANEEA